jgi:hypothetical protein
LGLALDCTEDEVEFRALGYSISATNSPAWVAVDTARRSARARFVKYLEGRPGAYLEDIKDFLYDEFDIEISITSVWRAG